MTRRYLCAKAKSRIGVAIFFALFLFTLLPLLSKDIMYAMDPLKVSPDLERNYYYFFSEFTVTFLLSPLFYLWLEFQNSYFNKTYLILRIRDINKYFLTRVLLIAAESLIFTAFIYILILFREICFDNHFAIIDYMGLFGKFTLQFFGFFTLALIFFFMANIFNSPLIGFIISYFFVIVDYTLIENQIDFSLIAFRTLCQPFRENKNYLFTLLFIIALDAALCVGYSNSLKHKQYLT